MNCLRLPAWPGQVLARKGTGSLGGMKMEGIGLYLLTASSKYVSDTNDTTGWTGYVRPLQVSSGEAGTLD